MTLEVQVIKAKLTNEIISSLRNMKETVNKEAIIRTAENICKACNSESDSILDL